MKVDFTKNFTKNLEKTNDVVLLNKISEAIKNVIDAENLKGIKNFRKLIGYQNYYRIKINNHRIGIEVEDDVVRFLTMQHRKDIYKKFP